jgi:Flp pilus assembly pilin Flp
MMEPKGTGTPTLPRIERFQLTGDEVVAKFKELVHEGNIRRIIIKNEDGHTLVEFPLTVGLVGAALAPAIAAIGAAAALLAECTIEVEKKE